MRELLGDGASRRLIRLVGRLLLSLRLSSLLHLLLGQGLLGQSFLLGFFGLACRGLAWAGRGDCLSGRALGGRLWATFGDHLTWLSIVLRAKSHVAAVDDILRVRQAKMVWRGAISRSLRVSLDRGDDARTTIIIDSNSDLILTRRLNTATTHLSAAGMLDSLVASAEVSTTRPETGK